MGQLPVLYIDHKALGQSVAIARYVAREHGLVPSNHFLAAKADMLVDGLNDQYENVKQFSMALMKGDAEETEKTWDTFRKHHLAGFLDMYENFLIENGGKYFVGDHLCWADLIIAEQLDRWLYFNKNDESLFNNHKALLKHMKYIHELPNIKKYVANRPKTLM
uniref:Glutathione S-transferase n=1 Tax=Romanomermis culicivorax TaxID=13658 RepID=A0A915IHD4_ROMCU